MGAAVLGRKAAIHGGSKLYKIKSLRNKRQGKRCRCNNISSDINKNGKSTLGFLGSRCRPPQKGTLNKNRMAKKDGRPGGNKFRCIVDPGRCTDGVTYKKQVRHRNNYKSDDGEKTYIEYPENTFEISGNACRFNGAKDERWFLKNTRDISFAAAVFIPLVCHSKIMIGVTQENENVCDAGDGAVPNAIQADRTKDSELNNIIVEG